MKASLKTKSLKIALLGYGKMGRLIETFAVQQGHEILVRKGRQTTLEPADLKDVDICIDFSHPTAVLEHVELACRASKNIVIGTTSWEKDSEAVQSLVVKSGIGMLYAPNFSIGFHYFQQVVAEAYRLLHPSYDYTLIESHHRTKADSPSGSAKALAKEIQMKNEDIVSVRCGKDPGAYNVLFDGPSETFALTHTTRNRDGYAEGALKAVEWLEGKKGIYSLKDMLSHA